MPAHPELDHEDRRLLDGKSDKAPYAALAAFGMRCVVRHWSETDFDAAAEGSGIVAELCTESNGRYRPERAGYHLDRAWKYVEEHYRDEWVSTPVHPTALVNLRREVVQSGVLAGNDLKVYLAILDHSENKSGVNPVLASVRVIGDLTGLAPRQVNDAMQRLESAASPEFPVRSVAWYKLKSGPQKGKRTRLWSLSLGWTASGVEGPVGNTLVSRRVFRMSRENRLSYFRGCIGNLALGEWYTTAEMAAKAGLKNDNRDREALHELYDNGELERYEVTGRAGRRSYRWSRPPTEAEAAQVAAERSARVNAVKARAAARRVEVSVCFFDGCDDTAPAGQSWCPTHQQAIDALKARQ